MCCAYEVKNEKQEVVATTRSLDEARVLAKQYDGKVYSHGELVLEEELTALG